MECSGHCRCASAWRHFQNQQYSKCAAACHRILASSHRLPCDPSACLLLADLYLTGRGVCEDLHMAQRCAKVAHSAGIQPAAMILAQIHMARGDDLAALANAYYALDFYDDAFVCAELAHGAGSADGTALLAQMHVDGTAPSTSTETAFQLAMQLHARLDPRGAFLLAQLYKCVAEMLPDEDDAACCLLNSVRLAMEATHAGLPQASEWLFGEGDD